jgi:hypothetical protein
LKWSSNTSIIILKAVQHWAAFFWSWNE